MVHLAAARKGCVCVGFLVKMEVNMPNKVIQRANEQISHHVFTLEMCAAGRALLVYTEPGPTRILPAPSSQVGEGTS